MAKKVVKKTAAKKAVKKAAPKKAAKKVTKKVISDKEREQRAANLIANSEKKTKAKRPKKKASPQQTSSLLDAIIDGMQDRKAKNITVMDLQKIDSRVCDYYVICDADSKTHVSSIADSVEEMVLNKTKEKAFHSEGHQNAEWILVDYINIVVHVFLKEIRDFYAIEDLWGDADIKVIE
ncbi:MAG: ribosome silencing factor [Sediminibacterium sp.]|nr:ribosome silencing factor [Sediminibacterium sp.]